MWPFVSKTLSAKLRMPVKQGGVMYGMFATVVVAKGNAEHLDSLVKACGERHFTGRFGKFACVAISEPTHDGIDFVIGATAAGQPGPDFHRELSAVLAQRVVEFNALLKQLQVEHPPARAQGAVSHGA